MNKKLVVLLVCVFFIHLSYAQKATITEKKMEMKTYMFSDESPIPDMEKNYPYSTFDEFTNESIQKEWNMVILENDYIKVFVNTDIGGKIWGAIEKSTGEDFLYYNHVVKFRSVGHRGPWTSGGLEFNYGIMSHNSTCSTPQDYVIKENNDGSVSVVIGAFDLHTTTKWNVEIKLEKDKAYVETIGSWYNTQDLPQPYYHYSNAAAKTAGNLEFLFPGSYHIGHGGKGGTWPIDATGRDISFYENNNFGGYKSYHVINSVADYMGGYWHDDNFGFGNIHSYDKMPGKKLWIWGLADEGMIWEDLLTDGDGQYIEFQSGGTLNQPMESSSLTPFGHREFTPYDSDLSTEYYFPLKNTGGMVEASTTAVLNAKRKDDTTIELILSALAPINGEDLVVISEGKVISSSKINAKPLDLVNIDVAIAEGKNYTVELGDDLLYYSSNPEDIIDDRPNTKNDEMDWDSAVGLFIQGYEAEKQYSYLRGEIVMPIEKSQHFYLKSLAKDPAYAPALNRSAFNYYRMMQYDKALVNVNKSLSIDTYDVEANYLFGLINAKLGKFANAKSGFSLAAQSVSYRTAAYTELAKLYLNQGKFNKALDATQKALMFNQTNVVALEIQAVTYRLQKNEGAANKVLETLYNLDNTSAFVVNERILTGAKPSSLEALITNELPEESYIALALKYETFGLTETAIQVLKMSPEDVKVNILLAYLDVENRETLLKQVEKGDPTLVFPYRTETYHALTTLMKESDSWKLKYYTSLILWKKNRVEESKAMVNACGDEPDFTPFYLSKANLFKEDTAVVKASLTRAHKLSPKDWRTDLAVVNQLLSEKEYKEAAKISKKAYFKNKNFSVFGMKYASALLQMEKYKETLAFLEDFEIIPFEGARDGRKLHHEAAAMLAFEALEKSNYNLAITYANKAKLWPVRLGAGEPFDADERLENSILSYCYKQLKEDEKAAEFNTLVAEYKLNTYFSINSKSKGDVRLYLQVMALNNEGKSDEATKLVNTTLDKNPEDKNTQWIKAKIDGDTAKSSSLEKELLKDAEAHPLDNSYLLLQEYLKATKQ